MAYASRPVPQNIMSVEFKLFDFMTLKQFMLSFGVILFAGLLFWLLPSPWNIIAPLVLVILGGIIIFIPFNGEPFQEFVSSYLEAMISPQRRVWNRKGFLIKTAYKQAKKYQFGNDPKEETNDFKFGSQDTIKVIDEQVELDTEEKEFLKSQAGLNSYTPPVQKQNPTQTITTPSGSSNISSKSVNASVDLNQLQRPKSPPQEQNPTLIQPSQDQTLPTAMPQEVQVKQSEQSSQTPLENSNQIPESPTYLTKEDAKSNITPIASKPVLPNNTPINQQSTLSVQASLVPQVQNQPVTQTVQNSINELKEMMPPKKQEKMDEFAVKNYIFGSVENKDGQGEIGAAVIIKKGEENLEILYTSENGDFLSHYEYAEGDYTIHVNLESKKFNEVIIHHNPIDPMPIIISPIQKTEENLSNTDENDDIYVKPSSNDNEIFDGSYDAKMFDLGDDYDEISTHKATPTSPTHDSFEAKLMESAELSAFNTKDFIATTPEKDDTVSSAKLNLEKEVEEAAIQVSSLHQGFEGQADTRLQASVKPISEESSAINNPKQNPEGLNMSHEALEKSDSSSVIGDSFQPTTHNFPTTLDENYYSFTHLPDIGDINLPSTKLPNMIHAKIVDINNNPLNEVKIILMDESGQNFMNLSTYDSGVFSTTYSLPNGIYYMNFEKQGYNFYRFYIEMNGTVVNPKLIQTIN
jgi:hypothetical protein